MFDLAATRTETYDEPGALPRVAAATLAEDLRRRDFTINAMAVALLRRRPRPPVRPARRAPPTSSARVVRVLHPGSFLDDPTRLLRAVRYETRLGFRMDEDTERAARAAIAEDALSTVSGARVRDELMDLLAEHEAPAAVERMHELGLDRALDTALEPTPSWSPRRRWARRRSAPTAPSRRWRRWCAGDPERLDPWLDGPPARGARPRSPWRAPPASRRDRGAELRAHERMPSELRDLLGGEPPEALALALALGAPVGADPALGDRPAAACGSRSAAPTCWPRASRRGRRSAARSRRRCAASSTASCTGRDDELRTALELAR